MYKRRGAASTILPKIYQVREIVKVTEHHVTCEQMPMRPWLAVCPQPLYTSRYRWIVLNPLVERSTLP